MQPSSSMDQDTDMDPQLTTIQPGGGVVMSIELAWGKVRRTLLRLFRRGYVRKMAETRQGTRGTLPFEPVDPRDLKFYRNQNTYWWSESDDPFTWRDGLPFVRVGLAELIILGGGFLLLAVLASLWWLPAGLPPLVLSILIAWFFRDPNREVPTQLGTVVSPADGKLVQIETIEDPELGTCVQFGIFLSIFNVHANRSSLPGRVVAVRYRPGKFLNALRPESARENENLDIVLIDNEEIQPDGTPRKFRIRQITGQFARRIVCWVRPGDVLNRGEMYGMIKLGSRTELIIPAEDSLEIVAKIGDTICAGSTTLARYRTIANTTPSSSDPVMDTTET
ncbi:phosphatidylserine decarboxylase [Rubripirellula sp.]|jgi:phosphatidylserine decarboxylase|nr:phosphatidylserine decarboxylase [Rubripirellula sp.]MDA9840881.1 phosphatidylserine decarboxylase [Rubripirellula sp.]